jgi:hypothetical protein
MRYRRYYNQKNRDGSRTVVSTGPVVGLLGYFLKLMFFMVAFLWPFAIIHGNLHGVWGWILGIVAEIIWLALIIGVWATNSGNVSAQSRFGGRSKF